MSLCTVFDAIISNIDGVLSINPSPYVFVFGDFNVYNKDWVTHSGQTGRSGELCYIFSISDGLNQMAVYRSWIPDCHYHISAFLDFFLSSDASICFTTTFLQ